MISNVIDGSLKDSLLTEEPKENKKELLNNCEIGELLTNERTNKIITQEVLNDVEKTKKYIKVKNPQFFQDFELVNLIGTGSEACAFKAKITKKNNSIITTKMIIRGKGESINTNEINISRKLKNKNIINTFGGTSVIKDELDCIMMEYAKYGNLRDFQKNILKRNTLSETLICFIAYQIINGLKYIHMNNKVCHFDIKPQNVVIDDYLNVKIIDFSVALDYRKANKNSIKLPFRGTNFYIPPEVIKSKTINITDLNKVDLYSLGVILYNLAFGSYPFDLTYEDSNNYNQIYDKVMKDGWEIKNDNKHSYSIYFIDFLKKLLEKNINERINIYEASNHYWLKGGEILFNEKEQLYNAGGFLADLITDHICNFNIYMDKGKKEKN